MCWEKAAGTAITSFVGRAKYNYFPAHERSRLPDSKTLQSYQLSRNSKNSWRVTTAKPPSNTTAARIWDTPEDAPLYIIRKHFRTCFSSPIVRAKNGGSTSRGRCYHPFPYAATVYQNHDIQFCTVCRYADRAVFPHSSLWVARPLSLVVVASI